MVCLILSSLLLQFVAYKDMLSAIVFRIIRLVSARFALVTSGIGLVGTTVFVTQGDCFQTLCYLTVLCGMMMSLPTRYVVIPTQDLQPPSLIDNFSCR
jgi:hypothetical protein